VTPRYDAAGDDVTPRYDALSPRSEVLARICIHTHTHTHTQRTHARTHTRTHAHTCVVHKHYIMHALAFATQFVSCWT
jgi:hypothetical protein